MFKVWYDRLTPRTVPLWRAWIILCVVRVLIQSQAHPHHRQSLPLKDLNVCLNWMTWIQQCSLIMLEYILYIYILEYILKRKIDMFFNFNVHILPLELLLGRYLRLFFHNWEAFDGVEELLLRLWEIDLKWSSKCLLCKNKASHWQILTRW